MSGLSGNNMKTESLRRALFVSSPDEAERGFAEMNYDGLYLGNEFCHFLIPTSRQIKRGLALCEKNGARFHLVLPVCPQPSLREIKNLIKILPEGTEVIANDWGLIPLVREAHMTPVAGRALISHVADPRACDLADSGDALLRQHVRTTAADLPGFRKTLKNFGMTRMEFNNLSQGMDMKLPRPFKGSIYYPYVYITTARKCITRYAALGLDMPGVGPCAQPCHSLLVRRDIPALKKEIFLKGNTHFYINNTLPEESDLLKMGIDRFVYTRNFGF